MAICVTTMPAAGADLCNFNLHFGRIDAFLYTRAEATDVLDDATDAAEWADRISNSSALTASGTPAPIRYHYVIGEWPLPERTEIEVSAGRTSYSAAKHSLTLDIDDTGTTNTALLATEQATTKRRRVWLIADGQLHGGASGYLMDVTYLGLIIPRVKTEKQIIQVGLKYEGNQTAPITSVVPIFS